MQPAASSFFRQTGFSSSARDRATHERFLVDTMMERRAEERQRTTMRSVRAFLSKAGLGSRRLKD